MKFLLPPFLASGSSYGEIIYIIGGIILASVCVSASLIAQIVCMVIAKKSQGQKAVSKMKMFSKINTSIGIICVVILIVLILVNGIDNRDIWHMLWPIIAFNTLGPWGLNQSKGYAALENSEQPTDASES